MTGVIHKTDNTYSIRNIWSCYCLDQFLTQAFNIRIFPKFSMFHYICLMFILLILVGVELPLCIVIIVVTLFQDAIICFLESS